jgi:glucokinase
MDTGKQTDILAFDIGGTRIKAGVVRGGEISAFSILPLEECNQAGGMLAYLLRLGRQVLSARRANAIGIAVRGIVDPVSGMLLDVNGPLSEYIGQPLAALLGDELGAPVFLENDARMYALGEILYGAGRAYQNMVCLTLGTGVGCSVALDRRILRGARGLRGILGGHITVQVDGPVCTCGNRGCLEALIGTAALVGTIRQALADEPSSVLARGSATPRELFEAHAAGDFLAERLVARFSAHLGAGIVSLIHVYDPDVVIVGGGIMQSSAQFLAQVQMYVDTHAWTLPHARVRVVPAQLGDRAALLGVAAYIQDQSVLQ